MKEQNKHIVILTSGFPFDDSEPFLETELFVVASYFETITIVPLDVVATEIKQPIPPNAKVLIGDFFSKNGSWKELLKLFFSLVFYREIIEIICNPRFGWSFKRLKTAAVSFLRATRIQSFLTTSGCIQKNTVFYSFWTDDAGIALALLKKKNPTITCYTRAHGWDLYFHTNPIHYLPFRALITRYMSAIVTDSQAGTDYILSHWKGSEQSLVQPARMGVKNQSARNAFPNQFVVVSCSYLVSVKRVHLLAEALVELGKQIPVSWVHFGDGPEKPKIQNIIENASHNFLNATFNGHTPNQEILRWYAENPVTVFVNVSESEGTPVSIMEAMSFGIPVIATAVGGNVEIVNVTNGKLIDVNFTSDELCEGLKFFFDLNQEQRVEYQNNAVWMQQNHFHDQTNYSRLAELFKS